MRAELVVIGGGPAGATLAALAAGAGVRTVLVERARFPRDKVCGEFLSAEGCRVLERLGLEPALRRAGALPIEACRLSAAEGPVLELPLPDLGSNGRQALGLSRARLDALLLSAAAARGVELLQPCEVVRPILARGCVAGVVAREVGGTREFALEAVLVAGADGRRSVLGRHLHPRRSDPRRSTEHSRFGFKRHFERSSEPPSSRLELYLFDGGYAGLGPIEDGRQNLGFIATVGALRAAGGSLDRLLDERLRGGNPHLARTLGEARPAGDWQSVGPLRFGPRRATDSGALFVGDAAGTVDPLCGEGLSNALCGAELALPFLLQAVERGRLTDDLARGYTARWRRAFWAVTWRVRALGFVFERPRLARLVLRGLAGPGRPVVPRLVAATRTNWCP